MTLDGALSKTFKKLFPNGRVARLLAAQVASQMGDASFVILLLWVVIEIGGSKTMVGNVAALNYMPILAFGMLGGVAADRFSKRKILAISDLVRAAIALAVPISAGLFPLNPAVLAAAGFCLYSASAFFGPARDSYIPQLVEKGDLVAANTAVQLSVPAGFLLGPTAISALMKWSPAVELFAFSGALFLVSVLFIVGLPESPSLQKREVSGFREISEGLALGWRDRRLRWLLIITAVDNLFIMGPAIVGTPIFVKEVLHEGDSVYALTEAMYATGMFLGLPLSLWLNRRFGQGKVLIAAIFIDGITYMPFAWLRSVGAMNATIIFHAVAIPMITVTRTSMIQRIVPGVSLGKIFGMISITVVGLTGISSALTGWVAEYYSVPQIYFAISILASLCAPVAMLSRDFREA